LNKAKEKIIAIVIFLLIVGAAVFGIYKLYTGGIPKPADTQQVEAAIAAAGFQISDITGDFSKITFYNDDINECISATENDIYFEFYICRDTASAAEVFSQAHSLIYKTHFDYPNIEVSNQKVNYADYSLDSNGLYSITMYTGKTVVYAYCDSENKGRVLDILEGIHYVEKSDGSSETEKKLFSFVRVLFFVLCIPMTMLGRNFLYPIVYKSAGVTSKELDKYGEDPQIKKRDIYRWLIEKSPKPQLTGALIILFRLLMLPVCTAVIIAIAGCFIPAVDEIINKMGIIIPAIILAMAISGKILNKLLFGKIK